MLTFRNINDERKSWNEHENADYLREYKSQLIVLFDVEIKKIAQNTSFSESLLRTVYANACTLATDRFYSHGLKKN